MTNVTTSGTETAAATIGSYLGTLGKGSATWSVKTPANYVAVGARYLFPMSGKFEPYAAATLGIANVSKQVTFSLNGADVSGSLPSLGVQLGKDLDGKTNNALFMLGGGVRMPFGAVVADVGVRYGRIFTAPAGTNLFRLHAAVGYRF
jgi:opacity protein-like surface antigen